MKKWILLTALIAALVGANIWLNENPAGKTPEELAKEQSQEQAEKQAQAPKPPIPPKNVATKQPGRVMTLKTNKGIIRFVLYEKDVPKSTQRIADLATKGCYDGVTFPRAEDWVIQTTECKKEKVAPMGLEIASGLGHSIGAVGVARTEDPNSNTSVFYIVRKPAHQIDNQYTIFGQVIDGMDVVKKIQLGDKIQKASVAKLTPADKALFEGVMKAGG